VPLDLDAWLAAGEVADVLGIAARRLRDWARYGHVRCYVADGVHRYSVGDVVNYQRRRAKRVVRPVTETAGNVM
jgi:predicted site-specific integrase-resolvase